VPPAPTISIIFIWSPEKYLKIEWSSGGTMMMMMMISMYYCFQSPVNSSLFGSSIFVSTLWSNAFSLFFAQHECPSFTSTHNRQTSFSV
jgi:hypothetical protein